MNIPKLRENLLTYELKLAQRVETSSEPKKKEKIISLKAKETSTSIHQ